MTDYSSTATSADAPAGYDLLLPPGWSRVPLNRPGARRFVRRMVEVRAGDQPRDTVTPVRVALERELLSVVDRAVDAGAVDLFMVAEQRHGKPVAATLTVTYVPIPGCAGASDLDLTELAVRLRDPGTETGVTTLACGPAVRTVRVLAGPSVPDALPADSPGAGQESLDVVVVDYVVPVPYSAGTQMLLTFSSPNLVVQDAMVGLFDAIASTLRWTWPTDRN
jgi:hypothetical protein